MPLGPWPAFLFLLLLVFAPPQAPAPPPSPSLRDLLPYPPEEREVWVALHLSHKASLHLLLGEEAARAYDRLLRLELRNQLSGKRSAFARPEDALKAAHRWILAIGQAVRGRPVHLEGLPTAPHHVLPHAREIRAAASALRLPYGVLAAIVDNEQYGGDKALGLSRGVREVADTLAEGLADTQGQAPLSRTLGLAQMSWEDALKQKARLLRFGAWDPLRPFPHTEAEAREALKDPYLNLLFTASRLRGYFNALLSLPRRTPAPWKTPGCTTWAPPGTTTPSGPRTWKPGRTASTASSRASSTKWSWKGAGPFGTTASFPLRPGAQGFPSPAPPPLPGLPPKAAPSREGLPGGRTGQRPSRMWRKMA